MACFFWTIASRVGETNNFVVSSFVVGAARSGKLSIDASFVRESSPHAPEWPRWCDNNGNLETSCFSELFSEGEEKILFPKAALLLDFCLSNVCFSFLTALLASSEAIIETIIQYTINNKRMATITIPAIIKTVPCLLLGFIMKGLSFIGGTVTDGVVIDSDGDDVDEVSKVGISSLLLISNCSLIGALTVLVVNDRANVGLNVQLT